VRLADFGTNGQPNPPAGSDRQPQFPFGDIVGTIASARKD
jgi:hypothetical protein